MYKKFCSTAASCLKSNVKSDNYPVTLFRIFTSDSKLLYTL